MSNFSSLYDILMTPLTRSFRLNVSLIHKIDKHLFLELHVYKNDRREFIRYFNDTLNMFVSFKCVIDS
jgi:hypothetical protein